MMRKEQLLALMTSIATVALFLAASNPLSASGCNPTKALVLLKQGQTEAVDGKKTQAVDTQVLASREAFKCYQDHGQSSATRGTSGKAAADILNGAAQDAESSGDHPKAVTLAEMALALYR